jgi:catechol 2,3-dioxygenase-like lactoylglutathione lyase family enzyme
MQQPLLSGITSIMLGVRDLKTSLKFYRDELGLNVKMQEEQLALLDAGPVTLGLSPGHVRVAAQVNGATEIAFQVGNVRATRKALMDRGVVFMNEPRQVTPTEWAAHFRDPDGHLLSIFGPEGKL